MPVDDNVKRHAPDPYSQTMPFTGGITKASNLGNGHTGTLPVQKGQPYSTGTILLLLFSNYIKLALLCCLKLRIKER